MEFLAKRLREKELSLGLVFPDEAPAEKNGVDVNMVGRTILSIGQRSSAADSSN